MVNAKGMQSGDTKILYLSNASLVDTAIGKCVDESPQIRQKPSDRHLDANASLMHMQDC